MTSEESVLASAEVEPYSSSTTERTTLEEDTIYPQNGTGRTAHAQVPQGEDREGVRASLTRGVDPDETHDGTS